MSRKKIGCALAPVSVSLIEPLEDRKYFAGITASTAVSDPAAVLATAALSSLPTLALENAQIAQAARPQYQPLVIPAPVATSPGSNPSPGPVITTLTPTFEWQAISGTAFTGYKVSLYNVTAKTSVTYSTDSTATSYTVPTGAPLVAGSTYVWNVRAINGTESGSPSNYLYFQTQPTTETTLPAPVSISPGSSTSPGPVITTLTPTFEWHAISGVTFTGYQVNLYNVTATTSATYTTSTSATSFTVPASASLIAGNTYVWSVRAINGTDSGPPSAYLYFQTPPAATTLPALVAVSPGTSASPGPIIKTLTPTFEWHAISGVTFTGYQINLHNVTANTNVLFTTANNVTSYTVPSSAALAAGNTYVWNVRALNGTQSGPPSVYLYFQTPSATATLPVPVSIAPGNTTSPGPVLTTLTPTLTWHAISGVTFTGYQVNLSNVTTATAATYTTGTSVTSFTVPSSAPLIAGDLYVWNVRALNGTQAGPTSTYLYFQAPPATTTTLPAPVSIAPGSSTAPGPIVTTLTPTLTWHAISGVTFTGYQITLYNITTGSPAIYPVGTDATSFTIPTSAPLVAGNSYVWNVRAINGTQSGPPSVYLYFQARAAELTLPAPVSVSPGTSASPGPVLTTFTPTLTWQAITGVTFTGYQINLHNVTTNATVNYTTDSNTTSYTITTPLIAGNAYVWNVRALNGSQSGPPSVYLYFQAPQSATTTLPAPVALAPGSNPGPGPVLTTMTPTLTWQAINGVTFTGYQVTLYDVTTSTPAIYTTGAGDTSLTIPAAGALVPGHAYVWTVRAMNGTQAGPTSNYLYFQAPPATTTTVLLAPVSVSPGSSISPGPVLTTLAAVFEWHAVTGVAFTGYQINLYNQTTKASAIYTTGNSATSFALPANAPLVAGDAYVWNVRTLNGNQSGPPSVYLYFQAPLPTILKAPEAISPGTSASPGPVLTTLNPIFSWNAITGISFTGYHIYIHDITGDTTLSYELDASTTSLSPTVPLTPGHAFFWNVRAINGTASGHPSVYLFFQTPAPAEPVPPAVGDAVSIVQPAPLQTTTFPTSIAAGETFRSSSIVKVANTTGAKFKGVVTTQLYATSDGSIDSSSVLIASLVKTLVIRPGKSVNVVMKIKSLPGMLEGTYSLLARTTDANGITADSSYGPTVQVTAPFVALSAAFAIVPAQALKSGATVVLSNFGNTNDATSLSYTLGFASDAAGQISAGSVSSGTLARVTIRAGKSIKLHLKNWRSIAGSLQPGSYYLTVVLTDRAGNSTSVVSSTPVVKA